MSPLQLASLLSFHLYLTLTKKQPPVFIASMAFLVGLYIVLALFLNSLKAFWSPDCGARFAMILNWVDHGSLIHWHYMGSDVDPAGQIHPLAFFLFHGHQRFWPMYQILFPAICGVMYRLLGFPGLTVIPGLSGLGTVVLLYATASKLRLGSRVFIPLVAGLGTPLIVYSVVFWDHSLLMFLTALSSYLMLLTLQKQQSRFAFLTGTTLGIGIWVHELSFALFLAVMIGALPLVGSLAGRRHVIALAAGMILVGLFWSVVNYHIYGVPMGVHMLANMGGDTHYHPYSIKRLLNQQSFVHRCWEELIGSAPTATTTDADLFLQFILLALLIVAYWLTTLVFGISWPIAPIVNMIAAALAAVLVFRVKEANGLLLATPLFISALAVPWDTKRSPGTKPVLAPGVLQHLECSNLFFAWISRATWLYTIIVLINPMIPGVDWGSRYLLSALPFILLLTAHAWEEQYNGASVRWRPLISMCAIGVTALSVLCQSEGIMMIRHKMLYHQCIAENVRTIGTPVVFSDVSTGAQLAAEPLHQMEFMVRDEEGMRLLLLVLHKHDVKKFTFVGDSAEVGTFVDSYVALVGQADVIVTDATPKLKTQMDEDEGDLKFAYIVVKRQKQD